MRNHKNRKDEQDAQFEQVIKRLLETPPKPKITSNNKKTKKLKKSSEQ